MFCLQLAHMRYESTFVCCGTIKITTPILLIGEIINCWHKLLNATSKAWFNYDCYSLKYCGWVNANIHVHLMKLWTKINLLHKICLLFNSVVNIVLTLRVNNFLLKKNFLYSNISIYLYVYLISCQMFPIEFIQNCTCGIIKL